MSLPPSPYMAAGLMALEQAQRIVSESCTPLPTERVQLDQALGRTLAEEVIATAAVPAFDNSAMDGYAVRAQDLAGAGATNPISLKLVGESRAGHPSSRTLGVGQAIAISTGAMMPAGADAVLRVEDTSAQDGRVDALASVPPGQDVRLAGDDIAAGGHVLSPGTGLGPAELGVLASLGRDQVNCTQRPRVCILTTGDELVPPGTPLAAGAVHDSNAHTLRALCTRVGAAVQRVSHVGDDREQIAAAIAEVLQADLTLICGGVSVGPHDHVKEGLAMAGVQQRFWGVALRPGKPTWFGVLEGRPVFALPGNPVSTMVTFILLAGPALRRLSGAMPRSERTWARLGCDYEKQPGRTHALRCRLRMDEQGWLAEPTGPQGSHVLTSMLGAQALAILPASSGSLKAGQRVEVEMLPAWVG